MGSLLWTSFTHTYTACEFLKQKTIPLIGSHAVMATLKSGIMTTLGLPQNSQSRCDLCRMHWTGSVHMSKHLWREQTDKQNQKHTSAVTTAQSTLPPTRWLVRTRVLEKWLQRRNAPHTFVFFFFHDKIREQCAQSWELPHCFLCGELLCLLVSLNRHIKAS